MSSGGATAIYIILIIAYFALNGLLASNASDIANDKGYEKRKWFHMCFWLGPVAYIVVAAMPDQNMRVKQDQTVALLRQLVERQSSSVVPANPVNKPATSGSAKTAFTGTGNQGSTKASKTDYAENTKERDYQSAIALRDAGMYDDAIAVLEALGDYSDAAEQIKEIKNLQADT